MPAVAGIIGFLGTIGKIVVTVARAAYSVGKFIFDKVESFAAFAGKAITFLARHVSGGFKVFAKGVRHVLSDIVHGRLAHLWEDYQNLRKKLAKFLDPVLRNIRTARMVYDEWFKRTIKPILDLIQQARTVLRIFRLFHLKFAEDLDRRLAFIESKIFDTWNTLRRKLNEQATIINLLLDPGLILRQRVLFQRLVRSAGELRNLLDRVTERPLFPKEKDRQDRDRGQFHKSLLPETGARLRRREFTEDEREMMADIDRELEALTGVTVVKR